MVGWTYQVKRRQIKKEGKKLWGENLEEKRKKKRKKKKERKKGEVTKRKVGGGGGGTERKKKEKRVGIKHLNKSKDCVWSEPSALVYIGILVTSTTTGHDGSVVSALASQAKVSIPSCGTTFFSRSIFFRTSVKKVIEQTIHQFGQTLSGDAMPTKLTLL